MSAKNGKNSKPTKKPKMIQKNSLRAKTYPEIDQTAGAELPGFVVRHVTRQNYPKGIVFGARGVERPKPSSCAKTYFGAEKRFGAENQKTSEIYERSETEQMAAS